MDQDRVKENILTQMETYTRVNLKLIKRMVLEGFSIPIKVNIMDNGLQVKNKEKECISILIRMYFQETGLMGKSMVQEPMYFQQQV
jgi:hypothetical protein